MRACTRRCRLADLRRVSAWHDQLGQESAARSEAQAAPSLACASARPPPSPQRMPPRFPGSSTLSSPFSHSLGVQFCSGGPGPLPQPRQVPCHLLPGSCFTARKRHRTPGGRATTLASRLHFLPRSRVPLSSIAKVGASPAP